MLTFSVNKGQQRVILHLFIMCFVCLRGWKLGRSGSGSKDKINTIRCLNIYIYVLHLCSSIFLRTHILLECMMYVSHLNY